MVLSLRAYTMNRHMKKATQNITVENARPSWNSFPTIVAQILRGAYSVICSTTFGITPPMPRPARERSTLNTQGLCVRPAAALRAQVATLIEDGAIEAGLEMFVDSRRGRRAGLQDPAHRG